MTTVGPLSGLGWEAFDYMDIRGIRLTEVASIAGAGFVSISV